VAGVDDPGHCLRRSRGSGVRGAHRSLTTAPPRSCDGLSGTGGTRSRRVGAGAAEGFRLAVRLSVWPA